VISRTGVWWYLSLVKLGSHGSKKAKSMFHLIWYALLGLIAGLIAKSVMHTHLSILWTVVLGIVGSVVGGCITHLFSRPREGALYHPAGLIFSIIGAILVLFLCHKLNLRLPEG
jgi:uncharacterized membrane protein YeaQ/YmgE (transglycosylase-associated protein family)